MNVRSGVLSLRYIATSLDSGSVTPDKQDWQEYFERLSRAVAESRAETDVSALPRGLQTDAPWVALAAVRYDATLDVIEIGFEMADKTTEDYVIDAPRQVSIDEREEGLAALEVIDCDGAAHTVKLREPIEVL